MIALVPATLLAAFPLAVGISGCISPPRGCEGGLCGMTDLWFLVAAVVWILSWPLFALIIWAIRKASRGPAAPHAAPGPDPMNP